MRKTVLAFAAATSLITGAAQANEIITAGTPGTTGATALYLNLPSEITTSEAVTPDTLASFLGRPDDDYTGLGAGFVTYDLGNLRIFDGVGQDFNVYEFNTSTIQFSEIDVLVSADGVSFFNVEASALAAVDLAGDELHGNASFRRSYDVGAAVAALGVGEFRYLRIDGTSSGAIASNNGFDLDAVGFANFAAASPTAAVPEPATWAMMILGFGAAGTALRRTRRSVSDRVVA